MKVKYLMLKHIHKPTENIFSTVILASHSFLHFVAFIGVVVRLS